MAEAVRTLAVDRDQALSRIAALERELDGVTGAIKHDRSPALPPPPLQPPPSPSAAVTPTTAAPMTEAAVSPAAPPASQQSAAGAPMAAPVPDDHAAPASDAVPMPVSAPAATGPGLGVDIGGAGNYEGLRTLWRSIKNSDPALLEELYPVVAVRENGKTHGAELRLVIGPLDDAESAAHLCATLAAAHRYCQPVAFEGQRFSAIDVGPTKAPAKAPAKATPAPSHHSTASSPAPKVAPLPVLHFEK